MLLLGDTGDGKTSAIVTLIEAGITPFILFTEPGMSTIGARLAELGLEDKVHWHYISQGGAGWGEMEKMAKNVNTMPFEAITKMQDPNKRKYTQWFDVLQNCANFRCDRTGETFGDVTEWGTDRALCIDSLSGLNQLAMNNTKGSRPTTSMPEWMMAQDTLERFVNKLCTDLKCHMVMTAHLEREQDEVTGGVTLMASTLGKKLAPKMPRNFDDVIRCKRTGTDFSWSTAEGNCSVKARNIPIAQGQKPSFVTLIKGWQTNGGVIKTTTE